ncbi:hypothetical protein IQ251_06850 [Saccharopolyspora sp. HNM0983]|uniref:Small secreted protein n=1 Tax=Saccharopolyspora montiporae TaxID=2781240 RepID=A0A929BAK7_9PSEU|nr:hypothetical protein [Saccharopolyspora sp. HNM0983]MBE9374163.1 hypothetical protein [Saccharopolyspora sp. HNM0983]
MRFRSTAVAVLAAVPLALAGCSAGEQAGDPGAQGDQNAEQQAPDQQGPGQQGDQQQGDQPKGPGAAWAGELCGLVGEFTQAQQNLPEPDRSNSAALKKSMVQSLGASADAADRTVQGLRGMEPSPIEGADQVGDSFEQGFVQVSKVLNTARDKAEQVDPADEQKFQEGMTQVQEELKKGEQLNLQEAVAQMDQNPELNAAVQQSPQCAMFTEQQQQQQPPQQQPPQ